MRFRRKIDDRKKLVLGHERVHRIRVGNIRFEKFIAFAMFLDHASEIGQIAGVSEDIHVGHERRFVMLQNVTNKIASDEPAAAGHKNAHAAK
jgi:hypothetical protein